ncbi:MAG: AEC family transporter [Pseudomonadota bacterium]
MSLVFDTVVPLFLVVLLGFGAGYVKWMSQEGVAALSGFVYYLAVPVMLFKILAGGVIPNVEDFTLLWAYYGVTLSLYALAIGLRCRLFGASLAEAALMGINGFYSNTVLLGIPLVLILFGDDGLVPLMLIISIHTVILVPLTTMLVEIGQATSKDAGRSPGEERGLAANVLQVGKSIVNGIVRNPIIMSLAAGSLYGLSGLSLPGPLVNFADLMGAATAPCALFALGASMAGFRIAGDLREVSCVIALKLLVHPLVMALVVLFVVDLEPLWATVAIFTAAMPAGVNAFVLASQKDLYLARSASIVALSTGFSVLSLSALVAFLL